MASRKQLKRYKKEHEKYTRDKEDLKVYNVYPISNKTKKTKIYSINRSKQLEQINLLKEKIIKYSNSNEFIKRDKHLNYLLENQQNDKKLRAKSLCDISNKITDKKYKLHILSIAVKDNYIDTITLNCYASALAENGNFNKAFIYFEKSLSIDNSSSLTLNSYASALANYGNFNKAFKLFDKALIIDKENTITLNRYASALANDRNFTKAFELFENSLLIDKENTITLNSYASALADNRNFNKAFELFDKALHINNKDIITLNSYASTLANYGDFDKAFKLFDKALLLNKKDIITLNNYASALANNENFNKAFELFKKALSFDEDNNITLNNYAFALAEQGNFKESFELFERSLNINSNDVITLNRYASALISNNCYELAFKLFEKAHQIDTNNIVTLNNYASALANYGNFNKAFKFFEKSLSINNNHAITLNRYASALADNGNYDKAFKFFEKSLLLDEANIVGIITFGIFLKNTNNYELAINVFEKALLVQTNKKDLKFVYLALGELYFKNKQKSLGEKHFKKYIEISDNKDKALITSALKILNENPYDEKATKMLLQVTSDDKNTFYTAFDLLKTTSTQELFYKYFNTSPKYTNEIKTIMELNSAIYHKVENQLVILDGLLNNIISKNIDLITRLKKYTSDLFTLIKEERRREKESSQINKTNYKELINTISNIAHDIADKVNNKIFVITSELNLLCEESKKTYKQFINQISILSTTLDNLKDIEQGSIEPKYSKFNLTDLLSNFSQNMRIGKALITYDIEDGFIVSDKQKISETINELVENTSRHNTDLNEIDINIRITIEYNPKIKSENSYGKYLKIIFSDNGKGIKKTHKEWIFNPLNSTVKNGSGLGLFIIKRIIEKLGGRIYEDGTTGAKFNIYLPNKG